MHGLLEDDRRFVLSGPDAINCKPLKPSLTMNFPKPLKSLDVGRHTRRNRMVMGTMHTPLGKTTGWVLKARLALEI